MEDLFIPRHTHFYLKDFHDNYRVKCSPLSFPFKYLYTEGDFVYGMLTMRSGRARMCKVSIEVFPQFKQGNNKSLARQRPNLPKL